MVHALGLARGDTASVVWVKCEGRLRVERVFNAKRALVRLLGCVFAWTLLPGAPSRSGLALLRGLLCVRSTETAEMGGLG